MFLLRHVNKNSTLVFNVYTYAIYRKIATIKDIYGINCLLVGQVSVWRRTVHVTGQCVAQGSA